MKKDWIIDVENLTKSFDKFSVVKGLSIQVARGQVFGFLGANGSGKTTSIRMICGLLTPDSGQGQCIGYDVVTQSESIKKRVGYMPQKFSLYSELSVIENLDFIAKLYSVKDTKHQIQQVMQRLDLSERAWQLAGHLSGGWKQRLAFAACLVHQPELLLLDEPTAGIDPLARRDFWDVIHQLSQEGVTTLMSTHYMDEAERCHSLAYLADGKILVQGSVNEVVESTGIHTFLLEGELPASLLSHLKTLPSVVQAAWFGRGFHVCGRDVMALSLDLERLAHTYHFRFQAIQPSLEDAFIALGGQG
jgi:ABC-2 type transport system ATP-binding protein